MPIHSEANLIDRHAIHFREYLNRADRENAIGFEEKDLFKVALQLSDNSFWMLTSTSAPVTWKSVGIMGEDVVPLPRKIDCGDWEDATVIPINLQLIRGNDANLPVLLDGELGYCIDTQRLYIGTGTENILVNGATLHQGDLADNALQSTEFTGANILAKLLTVGGANSKLDADFLDGFEGSYYAPKSDSLMGYGILDAATAAQGTKADEALPAVEYNATDILNKLKTVASTLVDYGILDAATADQGIKADNALPATVYTGVNILAKLKFVDGHGSELDADLLDGKEASAFATAAQGTLATNALSLANFTSSAVTSKTILGFLSNPGPITEADSILQAINKLNGNLEALKVRVSALDGL